MTLLTTEDAKSIAYREIDRRGEEAVRIAKQVLKNPEPGFREHKTSALMQSEFKRFGISFKNNIAITGLKGILNGGSPGPTVAVIGELDSHIVNGHRYADPETSAAHACGHHTQLGMLIASAIGLQATGVMDCMSGRVALMVIPAEEYIEIEYRNQLKRDGKLEFLTGKSEFIRLGEFDDVDMAIMTHTDNQDTKIKFGVGGTSNGMVSKLVKFTGMSAHAGYAPHLGVNALNAATLSLSAIHAQRETFRDEDSIRIHPIITKGGGAVSAVPDDVRVETFVRGKNFDAVISASKKVDRAFKSGAMATGASVSITTIPGYIPLSNDSNLQELHRINSALLVGDNSVETKEHNSGSTDMGDVSSILPAAHPYVYSASGKGHGVDYIVEDYDLAVLTSAKAMVGTVIDLLSNNAKHGQAVKNSFKPQLTKQEYLSTMRSFAGDETFSYD